MAMVHPNTACSQKKYGTETMFSFRPTGKTGVGSADATGTLWNCGVKLEL